MKTFENVDFEKVEIVQSIFNRCSLFELKIIKGMVNDGEIRYKARELRDKKETAKTQKLLAQ